MIASIVLEYLQEQVSVPFAWGSTDCVHFAGGLWKRLTGHDPLECYTYTTEAEAQAQIAEAGSLRALVTRELGEPKRVRLGGTEIEAGDVVLATYGGIGEIVGVSDGRAAWYRFAGRRGLVPALHEQCLCYWRPLCLPQ